MNKVSKWRKALGYTQSDMARIFNISTQAYYRKEKGYSSFNDKEKLMFKNMVEEIYPSITIDELFFSEKC